MKTVCFIDTYAAAIDSLSCDTEWKTSNRLSTRIEKEKTTATKQE